MRHSVLRYCSLLASEPKYVKCALRFRRLTAFQSSLCCWNQAAEQGIARQGIPCCTEEEPSLEASLAFEELETELDQDLPGQLVITSTGDKPSITVGIVEVLAVAYTLYISSAFAADQESSEELFLKRQVGQAFASMAFT